ncbi:helix-turn-helix protein [Chitinophaga niastensis]|uniref:Helix-turn-helix protein n=1 Tax=Chitinophaga niastensis TaxID=536980 RepID=A0A2P8HCF5_CHINA|nr:helix-turn-helix domain-containing protein [Chitinophaga niastensis]PSL43801.1 helix-turn-helix protein [Chitinophaga niastensis]
MELIPDIESYCRNINIPPPLHPHFDIRRFADNMKTVHQQVAPFRHECYAIALRLAGGNKQVNGAPMLANLFFNSPYQVISWDIVDDWQGYYIIFDADFVKAYPLWQHLMADFPYFRLDKSIPFNIPEETATHIAMLLEKIFSEYHGDAPDKFAFIYAYTHLLMQYVKRFYDQYSFGTGEALEQNRTADIQLVSRFQTLIASEFFHSGDKTGTDLHSPSYYANLLHVHPNYLNAACKRLSGKTASQHIQQHLTDLASQLLIQSDKSIKEISWELHFSEATHFSAFFKKQLQLSPAQYRAQKRVNS